MTTVLTLTRCVWRSSRRSWLSLAMLAALGAGAVMAAATGARRTDTAYTRFNAARRGADVVVEPAFTPQFAHISFDDVRRLPQVRIAGRNAFVVMDNDLVGVVPEPPVSTLIDRPKYLHGRAPTGPNEAAISFDEARVLHLRIGSRLHTAFQAPQGDDGAPTGPSTPVDLRIVGIEASPGEFPPHLTTYNSAAIRISAATVRALGDRVTTDYETLVRFRHGAADLPGFSAALHALGGDKPLLLTVRSQQAENTQRSFHLQAVALWLVALLIAIVTLAVLSQLLARQAAVDSVDNEVFGALGATRRQVWAAGLLRSGLLGLGGGLGAIVVAVLGSALTPIGTARIAEPHPGVRLDGAVLGLGVLATAVVLVVLAAWPLWRVSSQRRSDGRASAAEGQSAVTRALSGMSLPLIVGQGVRMALQRGRGRTAVPVVSSLLSVIVALVALVTAITFGASLDHLLTTPKLYGWNWDAHITTTGSVGSGAEVISRISPDPRVEAATLVDTPPMAIGRTAFDASALQQVKGVIEPVLLEGRAPRGTGEIALGTETMRRAHTHVGATVQMRITAVDLPPQPFVVVGRIVVAPQSDTARLGSGGVFDLASEKQMAPPDIQIPTPTDVDVRFRAGVDKARAVSDIQALLGSDYAITTPARPVDLVNFGQVQNLPLVLSGLLAVLGAATLAHALVSSIRQRRRDLSILKTLGLSSAQVRWAVAWQATAFVLVALVVGLPLGAAVGRLLWSTFASRLGALAQPVTPVLALALTVAAAVVVANLVAAVPAAIAGRLRPARVLRTE